MTLLDAAMYAHKADSYFAGARTDIEPLLPSKPGRVLELGCGYGATMRWLRQRGGVESATGVELMPDAAERARAVFDAVACGNVEQCDLPEGPFDLILALDVLEHLVDPWRTVARLHQVLSPGGCIIASLPNIAHFSVSLPLAFGRDWVYADEGLLDRTHLRFFTEATAVSLMTGSGLVVERLIRETLAPAWLAGLPRSLRWYSLRLAGLVSPRNLFTFRFLIRVGGARTG